MLHVRGKSNHNNHNLHPFNNLHKVSVVAISEVALWSRLKRKGTLDLDAMSCNLIDPLPHALVATLTCAGAEEHRSSHCRVYHQARSQLVGLNYWWNAQDHIPFCASDGVRSHLHPSYERRNRASLQ